MADHDARQGCGPQDPVEEDLEALSDDERRLQVLRTLAANGGRIDPQWRPEEPRGWVYFDVERPEMRRLLDTDLQVLARADYVAAVFFERLSSCPRCGSHAANLREVCPTCGSAHLVSQPLLHHFRCGYVAPVDQFPQADKGGRLCPKCNRTLQHLGTEYESPGTHFACRNCLASFQEPLVEGLCLSCTTRTPAEQLAQVDVNAYTLTPMGGAAIRAGRLFDQESEQMTEGDLPLLRRQIFRSLVVDDFRRARRYKTIFSLIMVRADFRHTRLARDRAEALLVKQLRAGLRDVDSLGRYAPDCYVINLPSTNEEGAAVVDRRLHEKHEVAGVVLNTAVIWHTTLEDFDGQMEQIYTGLAHA